MRIIYDKLVRDKVPDAIIRDGHTCRVEVLSASDYITELKRKLVEEAKEALEAATHEELLLELADLAEVIDALMKASGMSFDALEGSRLRRIEEKGGLEQRLLLRYVDEA